MVKKLKGIILGVLLISLSLYLLFTSNIKDNKSPIDNLPDYDYISEINTLTKEKRWSEANILCEDVIDLDLPCAQDAAKLKKQTEKESKKIKNRFYKAVKGFVTGSPDNSIEELGGSIASDMFLYATYTLGSTPLQIHSTALLKLSLPLAVGVSRRALLDAKKMGIFVSAKSNEKRDAL